MHISKTRKLNREDMLARYGFLLSKAEPVLEGRHRVVDTPVVVDEVFTELSNDNLDAQLVGSPGEWII